jgi:hypothetical protein
VADVLNRVSFKREISRQKTKNWTIYNKFERKHAIIAGEHIQTKARAQQKGKNVENATNRIISRKFVVANNNRRRNLHTRDASTSNDRTKSRSIQVLLWFCANRLQVNITKTEYMLIGTDHRLSNLDHKPVLILNHNILKRSFKIKNIRINLRWASSLERSRQWINRKNYSSFKNDTTC